MADFPTTTAARLRRVHVRALRPVLEPHGFVQEKPSTWVRTHGPLRHVLVLGVRHGSHQLEALVQDVATGPVVWGDDDGSTPGIVLHRPTISNRMTLVRVGDIVDDNALTPVVTALAAEAEQYEQVLRPLITRRALVDYLLASEHPETEPDRRFLEPQWWPLKVVVAATVAVLDGDPRADALVAAVDVMVDGQPQWNDIARLRRDKLHALVEDTNPRETRGG